MVYIDFFSKGDTCRVLKPILDNSVRGTYKFGIPMRAKLDYSILGDVGGVAIPIEDKDYILFISSKKSILCHSGAFVPEYNHLWRQRCLFVKAKDLTYVDCLQV